MHSHLFALLFWILGACVVLGEWPDYLSSTQVVLKQAGEECSVLIHPVRVEFDDRTAHRSPV